SPGSSSASIVVASRGPPTAAASVWGWPFPVPSSRTTAAKCLSRPPWAAARPFAFVSPSRPDRGVAHVPRGRTARRSTPTVRIPKSLGDSVDGGRQRDECREENREQPAHDDCGEGAPSVQSDGGLGNLLRILRGGTVLDVGG